MISSFSKLHWFAFVARVALGAYFIYLGVSKILHPVDFLKLVHQYELLNSYPWTSLSAALLPWFEVWCGGLLVLGIAVRSTALILSVLTLAFTGLVLYHALALYAVGDLPFCGVRFDCGCGSGEVYICRKLVENTFLLFVSTFVTVVSAPVLAFRYQLARLG